MFSKKDLCEAAWRELQKRKEFYPRMIEAGKMKQVDAEKQIALMHAIYKVLANMPDNDIKNQE